MAMHEKTKASIGHHERMGSPTHKHIADALSAGHDHYEEIHGPNEGKNGFKKDGAMTKPIGGKMGSSY